MEKFRKMTAFGLMVATVLSLSVVVAPQADAAAANGDLIKMDGLSSVYYLNDGKRFVFPNEKTYFSWYNDFSSVKTIPQSELESYPLAANVTIRPGTKLVKITTNPKVYAVEPGGNLRAIQSETDAKNLYGDNWAKRVVDVADSFFVNYKIGSAKPEGAYPVGQLVKKSDGADIFYFDGQNFRKIDSEAAFSANRFRFDDVVTAPASMTIAAGGTAITGAEATIIDTASGAGGNPNAGSGMTVALSSNTAPSATIIAGQATANLGSFNLTAANDGAVKVTQVKLRRLGVSADATLSAVYLYDGATRLTDSASVSSGYITFVNTGGIITIPAGTTKTITVKSNIAAATSGQTVGVAIESASDLATDGASVSGSFPMSGNLMSIAQATLATFALGSNTTPSGDGTPAPQTDYVMFENSATVSERAVDLKGIAFRMIGSINLTDLANFRLYVDGVQVGSAVAALDSNGYVTFDLASAPKRLETGTRVVRLVGDIKGGSTRTFRFSVRQAADVTAMDTEYSANVLATASAFPVEAAAQTVAGGSMSVSKAVNSASGNVIQGANGVSLGKFTMKASGEAVKIETLEAGFTTDYALLGSLRNGKLLANGTQIGSTASLLPAGTTYTVNYTIPADTEITLELVADIYDDNGANNATSTHTITPKLLALTGNAQGQSSLNSVDVPSGEIAANQLTIVTGSISMAKASTYGNQTVVVPQSTSYKLGSFVLSGNSSEDVNVNNLTLALTAVSGATFTSADITDLYVKYGTTQTTLKATAAASNSWSINYSLAKNASLAVEVYGKIGSGVTANDSIKTTLTVTGTTANSGQSVSTGAIDGQTITAGEGSFSAALDASAPVSKLLVGATTQDLAAFKFTTQNDAYTITEVVATTTSAGATVIANAKLMDGTTVLATSPVQSGNKMTFSGLSVAVPANSSKVLKVVADLGTIGTGAGTAGANAVITIDSYKALNGAGGETVGTADITGNAMYVFKAVPTITNVALGTSLLNEGNNTIAKFTMAADTNAVSWNKIAFTVAPSGVTVSNFKLYDDGGNQILGTFSPASLTADGAAVVAFVPTNEQSVAGASSKTYSLRADIAGVAQNDSISVSIAQPSTTVAVGTAAEIATTSASIVWSDNSANGHTTATSDWYNGYLVKTLPTDSQGLSK